MTGIPTVGVAAQSFGFGPASKAAAVARTLCALTGCRIVALGEGLAHEYFEREGLDGQGPFHPRHQHNRADLERLLSRLDGLVVALDPEWVGFGSEFLPTFFLDSLGFMWTKTYFEENPCLGATSRYFVQDLFGAASALSAHGVANLHPTSAIVARPSTPRTSRGEALFIHLGGLFNIYGEASGLTYLSNVVPILVRIANTAEIAGTALSQQAIRRGLVPVQLRPNAFTNREVARQIAAARVVVSSPGLTTLLECAAAGAPFLPLPPQNWSQALIVQEMAARADSHGIWRFLAAAYAVPRSLPEDEGVNTVAERNRELFATAEFAETYASKVRDVLADDTSPLVTGLGAPYDGAEVCARQIAAALGLPVNGGTG